MNDVLLFCENRKIVGHRTQPSQIAAASRRRRATHSWRTFGATERVGFALIPRGAPYLHFMRPLIVLIALTTPAHAWEFTPGLPCLLTHQTAQADVTLTYDPTQPLYTITIRRADPWPDAPVFGMAFAGPMHGRIGTDRHVLSHDKRSLTVTDEGFGNVLDGLQYNRRAYAITGDAVVGLPLDGAAEPVRAFRTCKDTVPVS